ncbi:nucleoporin [Niveomyces insectorum RCEF 264]|uniref:Nucleoporin NUP188 n=1 Tax=Niveomyces insectorum RCEF 264 TaxID=1081102 RepID=A0A167QXY0_9HYPO|nr:nucleoporin [Niveomyces insectorum RCEF 264]
MAPPLDHVYFPPLEELLNGDTILLSWKLVASALADPTGDLLSSHAVTEYLADPFVFAALTGPSSPFLPPTPTSASSFETKTAAINVTPTPNDKFDIQAIKADAIWLSKCAQIGEVAALRMVAIERQTRPQAVLAGPLSSQDATNISKATAAGSSSGGGGSSSFGNGTILADEGTEDAEALWTAFNAQASQRQRLFATYLSERRSFAAVADYIASLILHGVPPVSDADPAAAATLSSTLDALRSDLIHVKIPGQSPSSHPTHGPDAQEYLSSLPGYVTELRACMGRAQGGIEETVKDADQDVLTQDLALEWVRTALAEAVHYMSLIFVVLQSCGRLFVSPSLTEEWFRFVGDFAFFDGLTPGDDPMAEVILPLKTLACVNSLLFLNVDRAIGYLDHDIELDGEEEPYINDADVLESVHAAIVQAADVGLATASPVFLAWSLILHRMDVSYQERAERRDLAQNQRAQDGFELDYSPYQAQALLQPRGRRSSVGSIVSIEAAPYDSFLSQRVLVVSPDGESLVPRLAMTATNRCGVYDVISAMAACAGCGIEAAFRFDLGARIRVVFLEFLKASFPIVGYKSDPVSALLQVLSGGQQTRNTPAENEITAAALLGDDQLMQFYVYNALSRFPYEFTPFVSLCRHLSACTTPATAGLSDFVMESLLRETPSLTFTLPPDFDGYTMIDDADHPTATMRTLEDLPLFPSGASQRRLTYFHEKQVAMIPAGSYGRFMIDGSGIVNIDYEHSTLALLGKWLDASLADEPRGLILGQISKADVAETIGLLAALVRAEVAKALNTAQCDAAVASEAGLAVLEEASRDLDQAKDVISVVCDTVDTLIQDGPAETDEARMAVLTACMDFLQAVLPLCPGRVWSYMARCRLLNTDVSAGRLCILTGASDVVLERFNFVMASVRLFSGLVNNALSSAVQRKVAGKSVGRSSNQRREEENVWLAASDKTLAQVSLSVAQTVVDLYENTSTWKFASKLHCSSLVSGAVGVLRDVVTYAYGLEPPPNQDSLVVFFAPAAEFITNGFLLSSSSSLRFEPLLATLLAALELTSPLQGPLYPYRRRLAEERAVVVLEFAAVLLKVSADHHADNAGRVAAMEAQLFQIASLPARLCASHATLRPALDLLTDLVVTSAATASEPPSLLGYLGAHISRSFLAVLSAVDKPFRRPTEAVRIWKFFSTILKHRQQWMANCLLTGKTPREALEADSNATKLSSDSALAKAKEALQSIASLPRVEAMAVLEFLAAAQNYWPWTIFAVRGGGDYLDSMRAYVRGLAPAAMRAKTDAQAACSEARIAAYIAESFAMQLYHMRQMGTQEVFARDVVQDVDYYLRDGVGVAGYNTSLHANFQRNFAHHYPGCTLDQFKRSLLQPRGLGPQFYYALEFADKMLAFDGAWAGVGGSNKGFRREMETANINLSLVDAQIALFHAWEVLLWELSVCLLPTNRRLPVIMLQIAEQCLTANQNSQGPAPIFAQLAQSRANLALLLLQRLTEFASLPKDVSPLLLTVWTSIHGVDNPWSPEQAPYYRTLLRILYVVLRATRPSSRRTEGGGKTSDATGKTAAVGGLDEDDGGADDDDNAMVVSTTQTVLNVLDRVVAQGFRTLVRLVHDADGDADAKARPTDIALLTAVLQACLSTPGLAQCQIEVLHILAAHDVLHVATALFSWADQLLVDDGDPVYGELSLLFLRELAALPAVAEQLACDGFLSHLTATAAGPGTGTGGLAAQLRRPGVAPFSGGPAQQRCYSLWAQGVLPLLLHLLRALGTRIAPEVAHSVPKKEAHFIAWL